jgi:hypothetical protein
MTQRLLLNYNGRHDGGLAEVQRSQWLRGLVSHDSAAAQQDDHILCNTEEGERRLEEQALHVHGVSERTSKGGHGWQGEKECEGGREEEGEIRAVIRGR